MSTAAGFWDALAPHLGAIENSFLDVPCVRSIGPALRPPVLVVGAGQGLIVAELRRQGLQCDGVDWSSEMIRHAKLRRGIDLIQADARDLPFASGEYKAIICATGVVDFMSDEAEIRLILTEMRRVAGDGGDLFVGFYRMSAATERFLVRLGLLEKEVLRHREVLEIYRLRPRQVVAWVAGRARVSSGGAAALLLRSWAFSTRQEKRNASRMRRIFAAAEKAEALLAAAPAIQPYRNEGDLRRLFARLSIPIRRLERFANCLIAEIPPCRIT